MEGATLQAALKRSDDLPEVADCVAVLALSIERPRKPYSAVDQSVEVVVRHSEPDGALARFNTPFASPVEARK
jgi:hypothetical protein